MDTSVSVVMTTYEGDNQSELRDCFDSLLSQERQPDEVVIVRGDTLPSELVMEIKTFETDALFPVRDLAIRERGRGYARKLGVEKASSELIAIMDSDDIACPNRIRRQIDYFEHHPTVDAVGGYIAEFETTPDEIKTIRDVPIEPFEVRQTAFYRCPVNHPTLMFRRNAIINIGNYREMEYGEDYELCCRLLSKGAKIANIEDVLVKVRTSGLMNRRRGSEIIRREIQLQRAIVQTGFYGWEIGLANILIRVPLRCLPEQILRQLYRRFLRKALIS
jgi:glycosyltransferase involved in cell wall biosynthesis